MGVRGFNNISIDVTHFCVINIIVLRVVMLAAQGLKDQDDAEDNDRLGSTLEKSLSKANHPGGHAGYDRLGDEEEEGMDENSLDSAMLKAKSELSELQTGRLVIKNCKVFAIYLVHACVLDVYRVVGQHSMLHYNANYL